MSFVLTISEIAALVDGDVTRGNSSLPLTGIASLDQATPQDVSFFGNAKYLSQLRETKAGCVLVPTGVSDVPDGVALIEVENPTYLFSKIVDMATASLRAPINYGIHPSASVAADVQMDPDKCRVGPNAVIESGAIIGEGSDIGSGAVVYADAILGKGCKLYANSIVRERCELGDRVILQPGAVIGSDGYGYELVQGKHVKIDQIGIVVLGDDVEIGANATVDRARFGRTFIDEGTKVDNQVQIAHNVQIGKHCLIVAQSGVAGSTKLGDYVVLAAQAGVAGHLTIEDQAVIAGKAAVTKSITKKGTYSGNPARPMVETNRQKVMLKKLPKILKDVKELKDPKV